MPDYFDQGVVVSEQAWRVAQALEEAGCTRLRHLGNCLHPRSRSERRQVRIAAPALPYPKSLDDAA